MTNPQKNFTMNKNYYDKKAKNTLKNNYLNFFHFIGNYKWIILAAIALSIVGTIFNLIGPSKVSDMTNIITEGIKTSIDIKSIEKIAIVLCALYIGGFVFNYIQGYIMAIVSQRVSQNMRHNIIRKINKLPLKYFDSRPVGDTLSLVTNDIDTIGQTMNQSFSALISAVSMLIGTILMMFLTNWIMAIAGIISALIGFSFMLIIASKSQKYFITQQVVLGDVNGYIEETFSGHIVVKAYNGEKKAINNFAKMNDKLYLCAWKSQFLSGIMMPLMVFVGNLAYVVVCIVGAILAVRGDVSFGTIVAFMIYIRLFTSPLQSISQASNSVQSMSAACERVFEFLDEKEMEDESYKMVYLDKIAGDISFEHVMFGYTTDKMIIKDFSFNAKKGEKIAIVGPTGAGKTTIVNLLMRFYELTSGTIRIDGVSISEITRENINNLFGMVLQDSWLFEGTIRENLIYNNENVSEKDLDKVCQMTGIDKFIKQLPDGYDTIIKDDESISAGQKQLITIARAMLKDSPLLILDEATSNVDTRTELQVQNAMDKLVEGRTSFVIAHRLSTIKNADCILVVKDGNIVESGKHKDLLMKNGFYAKLYNSQFEKTN